MAQLKGNVYTYILSMYIHRCISALTDKVLSPPGFAIDKLALYQQRQKQRGHFSLSRKQQLAVAGNKHPPAEDGQFGRALRLIRNTKRLSISISAGSCTSGRTAVSMCTT